MLIGIRSVPMARCQPFWHSSMERAAKSTAWSTLVTMSLTVDEGAFVASITRGERYLDGVIDRCAGRGVDAQLGARQYFPAARPYRR